MEICRGSYEPRRPEATVLYQVVQDSLETLYGAIDDGALGATAADLMEYVLPRHCGLRQWVLTFPFAWRPALGRDGALLGLLTRIFEQMVQGFYALRAREEG